MVRAQLDRTNLADATLTGAYIEDWGITAYTKLDGIHCEFFHMRLPTKDDPEPWRKPDNKAEEFGERDFVDFIKPLQNTLELYHNQQVDPRAVAAAFNQLAENHPEAGFSITAMELRGENNDKFLLNLKTSDEVSHPDIRDEYFSNIHQLKYLPSEALRALLEEKDNEIKRLTGMVREVFDKAIKRQHIYAEYYHNEGDTMTEDRALGPDLRGAKIEGTIVGRDQNVEGVNAGRDHTGGIFNDKQLEKSNPSPTETEQISTWTKLISLSPWRGPPDPEYVARSYVQLILSNYLDYLTDETSPGFKRRAVKALKSCGQAAIEEFLDNPYVKQGKRKKKMSCQML